MTTTTRRITPTDDPTPITTRNEESEMSDPTPHTRPRTTVVKVGGARLGTAEDIDLLVEHVAELRASGVRPVVVHGGGPEINELHRRLEVPVEKRDGLRVTRGEGMDLTVMVLCGAVRTRIVERFAAHDVPAIAVSGADMGLLRAPLVDEEGLGRVGGPPVVDVEALRRLIDLDTVVVLSPVSLGPDGQLVNVNADDAAHSVATALEASSLDFLSDIPGVKDDSDTVLRHLGPSDVDRLIDGGVVTGGMVPKLRAAIAAVHAGVERVRIGDLATMASDRATSIARTGGALS